MPEDRETLRHTVQSARIADELSYFSAIASCSIIRLVSRTWETFCFNSQEYIVVDRAMKGASSSCSPQYVSQIAWCVDVLGQFVDEKSRGEVLPHLMSSRFPRRWQCLELCVDSFRHPTCLFEKFFRGNDIDNRNVDDVALVSYSETLLGSDCLNRSFRCHRRDVGRDRRGSAAFRRALIEADRCTTH